MNYWTPKRGLYSALLVVAMLSWGCPQERSGSSSSAAAVETDARASADDAPQEEGEASPSAGGKAVFPESEFDWGEVEQGAKVTHVFKVRNEGQEVLHIKRVRGS